MSDSSNKKTLIAICCIMFIGSILYSNTLNVPFYLDDINNIKNPSLSIEEISFAEFSKILSGATLHARPVSNISFALNYYFGGYRVQGYHLVNITIHLLAGIFLFLVFKYTIELPVNRKKYSSPLMVAFVAALLWTIHPLATQSITYIVQRMNSMATMFYVLSLLLYIVGRKRFTETTKNDSKIYALGWFVASALSGLLALGSKEIAATLPIFIFLYEWYFFQNLNWVWLKRKFYWLFAIALVVIFFSYHYLGSEPWKIVLGDCPGRDFTALERLLTQFRVVLYYIGLLFYPDSRRLALDREFSLSTDLLSPPTTFFSLGIIVLCFAVAIFSARRERLLSFCVLWFFGNLVIESSVICLELFFEHRTYLPSMFFLMLVVGVLFRLSSGRSVVIYPLFSVMALFLCFWTFERNELWKNPVAFWHNEVEKSVYKARPHVLLAREWRKKGRHEEGAAELKKAISKDPEFDIAYNNLGALQVKLYDDDTAEKNFRKALQIKEKYGKALSNLGVLLVRNGRFVEAEQHYRDALQLFPENENFEYNLGKVLLRNDSLEEALLYFKIVLKHNKKDTRVLQEMATTLMKLGRKNEAVELYKELLELNTDTPSVHYNLGILLAEQGETEKSLFHYKRAMLLTSIQPPVSYNLANIYFRAGETNEAKKYYEQFLEITPTVADAFNNLGLVYAQQGDYQKALRFFSNAFTLNPQNQMVKENVDLASELLREVEGKQNGMGKEAD